MNEISFPLTVAVYLDGRSVELLSSAPFLSVVFTAGVGQSVLGGGGGGGRRVNVSDFRYFPKFRGKAANFSPLSSSTSYELGSGGEGNLHVGR